MTLPEQQPEAWSRGAERYDATFERYTGLYAADALAYLEVGSDTHVLDVAAGSGAVTLRAAALGANVLGTDFAPGMVDVLNRKLLDAGHAGMRAEVHDGQNLDLPDDRFDLAISMFGVIMFPDPDAGAREMTRVVRPDGRVAIGVWPNDGFRLRDLIGEAVGRAIPGFQMATPPGRVDLGIEGALPSLLEGAGLLEVTLHTFSHQWTFEDPAGFFVSMPTFSPAMQLLFDAIGPEKVDDCGDRFAEVVAEHDAGDGIAVAALLGVGIVP